MGSGSPKSTPSKEAHCKNKLVPRGQQNRLHLNEDKTKNWCLRVNEIDPIEESALQKLNLPQGHRNRPHQRRHPSKGKQIKNVSQGQRNRLYHKKSTAKINLPQGHRNQPNQRGHPSKGKQTKRVSRSTKSTL